MPRPISVTVHITSLAHNLHRMRQAAHGRTLWAVVKANAYGHGLANAVRAFEAADGLATLEVCDALRMRGLGWSKRILLLEGFFDREDLEMLDAHDIETVVHNREQLDMIFARAPYKNLRVHIKVNSGMNRLGFAPSELPDILARISIIAGCSVAGVVTHFANAESTYPADGTVSVQRQLTALGEIAERTDACLANSAATLFQEDVHGAAVRAGVALYGMSPDRAVSRQELGLKAGMTFAARIIALQNVAKGQCVGYGSRWCAPRDSRIAVVACGYADGYPRNMPDGAPTYVEGAIAPLAGTVSMDMMTIDVTDIPQAQLGSIVELWGPHIDVDQLAARAGTIGYELMCALAPRVPVTAR